MSRGPGLGGTALLVVFGLIAFAGLLSAVFGTADSDPGVPPPDLAADPEVNCVEPPPAMKEAIANGLTVTGGGGLGELYAVRSGAHENAYFVAAEIEGDGMGNATGVWLVNGTLEEPAFIVAVDQMAREFSDWGSATDTELTATMADPGASESRGCLREGN